VIVRALALLGAWALLGAIALAQPADVEGFGEARLGMTVEELRAALGGALVVEVEGNGELRLGMHVVLGRTPLPAQLLVTAGAGLTEIRIGPDAVPFSRERDAEAIETELRQMFGHNLWAYGSDEKMPGKRLKVRDLTWTFPSATVAFRHRLEETPAGVTDELSPTIARAP
jgi:hypothetical protein